jgi:hypothetical protein
VPRYIFTAADLVPLFRLIDRPDIRVMLSTAVPVKQFNVAPVAVEAIPDPLPVGVRSRDNPSGIPLGELDALVKQRVPGVSAVLVRNGSVLVAWSSPPTVEARASLKKTITDKKAIQAIVDKVNKPPAANDQDLKKQLLDANTSDADWLRAFRRFQTAQLAPDDPGPNRPGRPAR